MNAYRLTNRQTDRHKKVKSNIAQPHANTLWWGYNIKWQTIIYMHRLQKSGEQSHFSSQQNHILSQQKSFFITTKSFFIRTNPFSITTQPFFITTKSFFITTKSLLFFSSQQNHFFITTKSFFIYYKPWENYRKVDMCNYLVFKINKWSGGLMVKVSTSHPRVPGFEPHTGHDHDSS